MRIGFLLLMFSLVATVQGQQQSQTSLLLAPQTRAVLPEDDGTQVRRPGSNYSDIEQLAGVCLQQGLPLEQVTGQDFARGFIE
jgi:hypothetical protein